MSRPTVFSAAGVLTAYCAVRPRLLEAITDSLAGQPRAQSYDGSASSSAPWCWEHQQPVSRCHQSGGLCDGETIESHDPTGEAAVSFDQARSHQDEVARLEQRIADDAARLDFIRSYYLPKNLPTGAERAKLATEGDPGCAFCWEHSRTWAPPVTKDPSTVAGNLPVAKLTCRAHYDFIRSVGRAPTKSETQHYNRKGRWPRQKAA